MSIALPFVAFLLAGAFAAYHRLRLAWWAAITATLLVGCWLLGANPVATVIAGALTALIALPLLIPAIRKPLITAPLLKFYRRILPRSEERTSELQSLMRISYAVFCLKKKKQQK